jgi:hypothetical protein
MFSYGNGEPGMGKIPDWHPRYKKTINMQFCQCRHYILVQKTLFYVKSSELFTI